MDNKWIKVGDALKVMNEKMAVVSVQSIDGVNYELYRGTAGDGRRGAVRIYDMESENLVQLRLYQDFLIAEQAFEETLSVVR